MNSSTAPLEPIVAHGSRMSWAGMLRPGDEFPRANMSRLAVLRAESGPPLTRYFGSWSTRYRRFTTNLSSARIEVRTVEPGERPGPGIVVIVHWIDANDLRRSDVGGVRAADGWSPELWNAFTSEIDHLPLGTISEKLRSFLDSRRQERDPIVAGWREMVREGATRPSFPATSTVAGWVPVPARLTADTVTTDCIVSWDPQAPAFDSLSDALESPWAVRHPPDRMNQARYFLECELAQLHGVRFGSCDSVDDRRFARSPECSALREAFARLERARISDPERGLLDRFGRTPAK